MRRKAEASTPPRDKQPAEHGMTAPGRKSFAGSDKGRAVDNAANEPQRPASSRRSFRGVPPPPEFDFDALADGALLSEYETAQVLRGSMATLQTWRSQARGPPWLKLVNGIRYRVADIRAYLALPRTRKYPTPPRRPRRRAETSNAPLRSRATANESVEDSRRG